MSPEFLQGFFRAGIFIALISLVLVFATNRNSAEFVVSVCSLMIGLLLTGLVTLAARMGQR